MTEFKLHIRHIIVYFSKTVPLKPDKELLNLMLLVPAPVRNSWQSFKEKIPVYVLKNKQVNLTSDSWRTGENFEWYSAPLKKNKQNKTCDLLQNKQTKTLNEALE